MRVNIERIGGVVEIESVLGRGLKLTLRVPMTLTIIPALTFSVGSEYFAIPRGAIDEIARSSGGSVELEMVGNAPVARIRGERLPVVDLAALLGIESYVDRRHAILVVVRASGGERYALAVDSVQDHEELVVKPAAPAIMATGVYGGTTLPDNGRPMLLINPAGVAMVAGVRAQSDALPIRAEAEVARVETVPTLLFRGLDAAVRTIRLSLVERIEDVPADAVSLAGGRLSLSHSGRILPLFGSDGMPPARDDGTVRVLLLGDARSEIAYAIDGVIDIHDLSPDIEPSAAPGPIAGVLLVDGRQVELIDPYWLFAAAAAIAASPDRPLCLLDGSDAWMRDVLGPIVEQAGYRIGNARDAGAADDPVAVLMMDNEGVAPGHAWSAPVIRLRAAPGAAAATDSIYRYDRNGLIAALASARLNRGTTGQRT